MHYRDLLYGRLLFVGLAPIFACGDGGIPGFADAICHCTYIDAGDGGRTGLCNPVSQMGCEVGEKCAQVVEGKAPFLGRTMCVPNGSRKAGEVCESGEPGQMGYDDCEKGLACHGGFCVGICSTGPPEQRSTACCGGIAGGAVDRSRCPVGCIAPDDLEAIYQSFPFAGG